MRGSEFKENDFFTRHSVKPKGDDLESQDYDGISEQGVELAKQRAQEILAGLDEAEGGSVLFLGGASEMNRTKSTALVYGHEIKQILSEQNRQDVVVFMPEDVKDLQGYSKKVEYLIDQIKANPDKKFILDFPMFLKNFGIYGERWRDENDQPLPYLKKLLYVAGNNEESAMSEWFKDQGKIDNLIGPNPKEIAEEQLVGIKRLREFAEKYLQDRPLIIGSVGHSWNLDAVAVYLANNGEVDFDSFENMRARMIKETGMIRLEKKDDKPVLCYGDLEIPLEK